jgi:uncharacterized protein YidB (DUF937 family)
MGIFDGVLGVGTSALSPILAEMLGGQGGAQPGLGGLIQRFDQAGHGDAANSWVGSGPNQSIEPGALRQVFGQDQVNQWSQQTGMAPHDLLGQLSQFLPAAIDRMTPNGRVQEHGPTTPVSNAGDNPFDGPGVP